VHSSITRLSPEEEIAGKVKCPLRGTCVLKKQELVIIGLIAQGFKNGEVAQAMGATKHVVKNCLRTIYEKLGLWNRVDLALWYEARQHDAN
jgi:DNA-binding NarL/FixJ family response regulator